MPESWNTGARKMAIAMQWLSKHVPAASTHTTVEEPLGVVFSMWSAPMPALSFL
jgi:hypothetical protein